MWTGTHLRCYPQSTNDWVLYITLSKGIRSEISCSPDAILHSSFPSIYRRGGAVLFTFSHGFSMSLVSCTIVDWRTLLLASSSPSLPSSRSQVSMESLAWLRSPFWGESPVHYLHRALFVFPLFPLTVLSLRNLSGWLWDLRLRMVKDEESFWDSQETTSSSIYANDGRDLTSFFWGYTVWGKRPRSIIVHCCEWSQGRGWGRENGDPRKDGPGRRAEKLKQSHIIVASGFTLNWAVLM